MLTRPPVDPLPSRTGTEEWVTIQMRFSVSLLENGVSLYDQAEARYVKSLRQPPRFGVRMSANVEAVDILTFASTEPCSI